MGAEDKELLAVIQKAIEKDGKPLGLEDELALGIVAGTGQKAINRKNSDLRRHFELKDDKKISETSNRKRRNRQLERLRKHGSIRLSAKLMCFGDKRDEARQK